MEIIGKYKDYIIAKNPPEAREFKYQYYHVEYDGPEDNRCGDEKTIEDCKLSIDEYEG